MTEEGMGNLREGRGVARRAGAAKCLTRRVDWRTSPPAVAAAARHNTVRRRSGAPHYQTPQSAGSMLIAT